MKHLIDEGSIFLVPLRDDGYAVGVLARISGKGHCYGYFFGQRVSEAGAIVFSQLIPDNAVLIGKFGDLELRSGGWKWVGKIDGWDSSLWEFKPLARIDESAGRAWLSVYDDKFNCIEEREITVKEAGKHPYDRMMGAGSVEIRLTKLVSMNS